MPIAYGDAITGRQLARNKVTANAKDMRLEVGSKVIDVSWLPMAAKTYYISDDINSYVFFKVPAVTSDIPNRNCQEFSREELMFFNPLLGRLTYQTFIGKPVHVEHNNEDPTRAKGVIVDASLVYVPRYDVYKVILLAGLDKDKDPELVRSTLKGDTAWSMGALVDEFRCSICKANVNNFACSCFQAVGKGGLLNGQLVYERCVGVNYIEVSLVGDPADVTAWGSLLE